MKLTAGQSELIKRPRYTVFLALFLMQIYFKYFPFYFGKLWVWQNFVARYLLWRTDIVVARTWFGALTFPPELGPPEMRELAP